MAATDRLQGAALETNVQRTPNEEMYRCYLKVKNSASLGLDAQKNRSPKKSCSSSVVIGLCERQGEDGGSLISSLFTLSGRGF